jgi:hypothetical protein
MAAVAFAPGQLVDRLPKSLRAAHPLLAGQTKWCEHGTTGAAIARIV